MPMTEAAPQPELSIQQQEASALAAPLTLEPIGSQGVEVPPLPHPSNFETTQYMKVLTDARSSYQNLIDEHIKNSLDALDQQFKRQLSLVRTVAAQRTGEFNFNADTVANTQIQAIAHEATEQKKSMIEQVTVQKQALDSDARSVRMEYERLQAEEARRLRAVELENKLNNEVQRISKETLELDGKEDNLFSVQWLNLPEVKVLNKHHLELASTVGPTVPIPMTVPAGIQLGAVPSLVKLGATGASLPGALFSAQQPSVVPAPQIVMGTLAGPLPVKKAHVLPVGTPLYVYGPNGELVLKDEAEAAEA